MTVGNGSSLSISHIESSIFHKSSCPLYLNNILHVPRITKNLISVSKFTRDNNVVVEFFSDYLLITDKTMRQVLLKWMLKDGLYQLDVSNKTESVMLAPINKGVCPPLVLIKLFLAVLMLKVSIIVI